MADLRKRVIVEGDSSGVDQVFDDVRNSGNALYRSLKSDAQNYSDSLKDQAIYIERLLALEGRRNSEIIKQNRQFLEIEKERELSKVKGDVKGTFNVEQKYGNLISQNKIEDFQTKQQILEARQSLSSEYGDRRFRDEENYEQESNRLLSDGRLVKSGMMRARTGASGMMRAVTAGLGIGMGFGIFGILYSMVEKSAELDKAMSHLGATMDNTTIVSGGAAAAIGKSSAEMAELTRNFAISSGGMFGRTSGGGAFQLAQFARAFSIDENLLLQQMPTGRMGGANMNAELLELLREMKRSGAVSPGNFAQLTEKIEYWSRLNTMQSNQLINVLPGISTVILGAMQNTGLSILSDQRQLDFINGMNESIRNPNNDFKRAFMMDALSTGDFVGTQIKMEQGIFGRGNVQKILESLMNQYGNDKDSLTIAFRSLFNTSMTQSKYLVENLLTNPDNRKQFYKNFDKINDIEDEFNNLEAMRGSLSKEDFEKRFNKLTESYNVSAGKLKDETGIDVGSRAIKKTGEKEQITSLMTNTMATLGSDVLESLKGIVNNQDIQDAMKTVASGISFASSKIIAEAAPILKESAELFLDGVKFFNRIFNNSDYQNIIEGSENISGDRRFPKYLRNRAVNSRRKAGEIFDSIGEVEASDYLLKENDEIRKEFQNYLKYPNAYQQFVDNPALYEELRKNNELLKQNNDATQNNTDTMKSPNGNMDLSKAHGEEN